NAPTARPTCRRRARWARRNRWHAGTSDPRPCHPPRGIPAVSKPFDATTRYLLEAHPDSWPGYVGSAGGWPVRVIDSELSTITSESDKVLRVEAPEPWLLHIELQSSYDSTLARRLLRYNVLLDGCHDLPVQSVAVLLRAA